MAFPRFSGSQSVFCGDFGDFGVKIGVVGGGSAGGGWWIGGLDLSPGTRRQKYPQALFTAVLGGPECRVIFSKTSNI